MKSNQYVSTGLSDLDELTGGMCPGDLALIVGASSSGKSTLALNVAAKASETSEAVVVFYLESTRQVFWERLVRSQAESRGVSAALGHMEGLQLYVDDACGCTVNYMHAACIEVSSAPRLIVVDYIELMDNPGEVPCQYVTRAAQLKALAVVLKCPVLAVCNAFPEGAQRSADTIIECQLHEDSRDAIDLIVQKSRRGPGAMRAVWRPSQYCIDGRCLN